MTEYNQGINKIKVEVYVKQPLHKSGQTLRVPGLRGTQISRQSAHECGKVVNPKHWPPLPSRKYTWYPFLLEAESRKDYVNENFHRELKPRPSGL